jgi:DEAD/DEAH box helicase domain-containing protein
MCDRQDLGTTLETGNLGRPTLFVYDRYPGGLGFAEKGFERIEEVLRAAGDLVGACECRTGCPSCVGVPPVDPALHDDPEVRGRPPIPGKAATKRLIALMAGETA